MFQFPGFAFVPYVFRHKYLQLISASPKPAFHSTQPRKPEPVQGKTCSMHQRMVRSGVTDIEGGFPHSEIFGSKPVRSSPKLIAAYHVLHRLSAPRHPPDTLKTLDRSHYRCSPACPSAEGHADVRLPGPSIDIKTSFASNISGNVRSARPLTGACHTRPNQWRTSGGELM